MNPFGPKIALRGPIDTVAVVEVDGNLVSIDSARCAGTPAADQSDLESIVRRAQPAAT